jgi:uncharacterized metal-binding protein
MPSGRTHLRVEAVLLAGWSAIAVLCRTRAWITTAEIAGFVSAYLFSMLLLSPDLDLAESDSYRRWGPLRWLWAPYAAAFKHRRISHHPLFGPITRIAYLGLIGFIAAAAYALVRGDATVRFVLPFRLVLAVLVGLYLPNLTHIALDGLHSLWVRMRSRL